MDYAMWLNTIVCIVGIIVGIIGWRSLLTAIKIKNSIKADNGSTVQQATIIHNGLSSSDIVDITERKINDILIEWDNNDNIKNSEFHLFPKYIGIGDVFFQDSKICAVDLPGINSRVLFKNEADSMYYPTSLKCSVLDESGKEVLISLRDTTIDILPTSIYDGLYSYVCGLENEVIISKNQTAVGYISKEEIIFVTLFKEKTRFAFRIAVYGPRIVK